MSIKPKLVTLLAVFDGTDGDDHISGTEAADQFNGGLGNDKLYGRGGDDVLDGGAGDDQLNGGLGADRMVGGAGNDIYIVDNIGDRVVEASGGGIDTVKSSVSFSLGGSFIENLTLTGDGRIDGTGNSLSNTLIGNRAANTLYGLGGNDVIDGGFGADTMYGGTGNDTYYVDNLMDRVIENAGEGTDTVRSSVTFTLSDHVENLTLTGTARSGSGNALNNTLRGESTGVALYGLGGDDRLEGSATHGSLLDGGTGADMMIGGLGNDTYYVDNVGDRIVETGNGGVDTVYSSISFNLGGGFANNITLGDLESDTPQLDLNGLGNSLDNILIGNNGRNRLEGKAGKDELYGHGGDDTLLAGDGTDLLFGGEGNDYLDGGLGNDRMEGGAGDDWLVARGYNNIMTGGEGIDRFEIRARASSSITDFRPGEDYILISAAVFGGGLYAGMDLEEEDFYQPDGGPATGDHGRLVYTQGVPGWGSSLHLDPDGSGPEAGITITLITGGAPLLEDIIIVA
ncbi:hypothetical protein BKE38_20385 [Pseudoroseomonas deserti]|uniref:Calcium-binding protein n=1 Tax=Teichococcus deserti TaxID=1817963 RepID=A0A1V2H078_9PROT|nr:calcium-binding protein [Pseudoroseomonas deserti]ONG49720.1 hypothetical protein BKE38_20385 [Pseudoroseomonas deserti]